ncbi:hypothetical protein A0H81_13653 [Grifola frondosa]|uniref:Uncharacterized protein n=1 Tax=Grifola frondosa TaxID=5627 RepID=A0A1C7LNK9_GRIFR|nr:hypothetical protein A0H81_13653 [Grifola frondosa]
MPTHLEITTDQRSVGQGQIHRRHSGGAAGGTMAAVWRYFGGSLAVLWRQTGGTLAALWRQSSGSWRHCGGSWRHCGGSWRHSYTAAASKCLICHEQDDHEWSSSG